MEPEFLAKGEKNPIKENMNLIIFFLSFPFSHLFLFFL